MTWCTSRIYHSAITNRTGTKNHNSGRILISLQATKLINLQIPSPLQSRPVYSLKITKHRILQYWVDCKLTHMADWEVIYLTPFERARDRNIFHMSHFIMKFMINTLSTMNILQQWGHASTNLYPCCGTVLETIHHMSPFTQGRSCSRWTAPVDTLR